jgi:DNA-binding transcriptional ArsR family regulator
MNNESICIRKNVDYELINKAEISIKENKDLIKTKSEIFSLLGSEVRLSIISLLSEYKKLCVCDISDILNISQSSISQHLRKLKDGKLIDNIRDGSTIFYFINDDINAFIKKVMEE